MRSLLRLTTLLLAFAALPSAAHAQGRVIPRPCAAPIRVAPDDRPIAQPPCRPAGALERTRADVRIELADRVLRYEIRETFVNRGGAVAEADYVFPLPTGAAFQELQLQIGDEMVSGEVLDARQARQVYEEIVRRQRDPALVEWMGRGLLRARIFPIAPGETKRVVVRYAVVAPREGDALRVDYTAPGEPNGALAVAERWEEVGVRRGEDDRSTSVDRDRSGSATRTTVMLRLPRSASYGTPYSPTHRLEVQEHSIANVREVRVRGSAGGPVTILVPVRQGRDASIGVLTHRPSGRDDGFALITVAPPAVRAAATPRDVVFVIDVSGSMRGDKLAQAQAAGRQLLATLDERDRFRVVAFSSDVRSFRSGWSAATRENVRQAGRYLDDLRADGSTNISGALAEALDAPAVRGRLPIVLFLTDGAPTVGERDPDAIAQRAGELRGRARLFTFGVGADVNAALMEQLALQGGGTAQFVRPEEDVERAVAVVASRLTQPLVTDLRVTADGVRLLQSQPNGALDLFAGQELVVLTRYRGDGAGTVRIDGTTADGPVHWTTRVRFPERERENAFVAKLWATQRIGWLSAERRRRGPSNELDDEIRFLGTTYGIPTELSSYLVLEPGTTVASMNAAVSQPVRRRDAVGQVAGGASGVAPQAAPAPARAQFGAAKAAAEQRAAVSLADAAVAGAAQEMSANGERQAGGHRFVLQGGVWTDAGQVAGRPVIRVKPFSDGYFRLLELLPELREPFTLGERVIVAGRAMSVEVAPDAPEHLDAQALARVRRDW